MAPWLVLVPVGHCRWSTGGPVSGVPLRNRFFHNFLEEGSHLQALLPLVLRDLRQKVCLFGIGVVPQIQEVFIPGW